MEILRSPRLESFRVVALCGRVSEAARRLNLSQPAVSAQIRQLEEAYGRPLFLRHPGGVRLTAEGRQLLEVAQRMQSLLEEAARFDRGKGAEASPLLLAASTTLAAYVLPPLLAAFTRRLGPRALRLEVGNTEQVLTWVKEGRAPLGLVEGLRRAPGLHLESFLEDELWPVRAGATRRVPLARRRELRRVRTVEDLAQVPLLWREPGSGTRAVVERALAKALRALGPRETDLVLGHTEAIKGAVLEGLGIGFLSRWSLRGELRRGEVEVVDLPGLRISRAFSWVQASGALPPAAAAFRRFAAEWARQPDSRP